MKRRSLFAIAALSFAASLLSLPAQDAPAASDREAPAGAKRIAVFPYGDPGAFLEAKDAFARYAIPDMIRMELARQGRFEILGKEECEAALAAAGGKSEAEETQERMRAAALALGADHYVWGYIGSLEGGIGVFHRIVDAGSGATVHESFARLPSDQGIFDALERSVGDFGAWIGSGLPVRGPDIVYVEKEVIVEKPGRADPPSGKKDAGVAIGGELSYRLFAPPFASWLKPALRAGVLFELPSDSRGFRLGFLLQSSPLFQASGGLLVLGGVTVIQSSLLARVCVALPLAPSLEARFGASAGGAFFAGFVSPQSIAYLRPSLAVDAGIEWRPVPRLGIGLGARGEFTALAWGSASMLEIAPVLTLRYLP